MALKSSNGTRTSSYAQANEGAQAPGKKGPRILGYVNIGIATAIPGDQRRVDSIRLMEGNPLHEVIFAGLNAQREGDPVLEAPEGATKKQLAEMEEARKALLAERLAGFVSKLVVSFNPSRTDADSELINF